MSHSLIKARQTIAEVLAAAASELFPGTLLFQGEGTDKSFFYDFVFPFPFQAEFLTHLEERMRQIVRREDHPIRQLEMVPENAAALLRHKGNFELAERVESLDSALVRMAQVGEFVDWCEEEISEKWNLSNPFKLIGFYSIVVGEDSWIRVVGALEESKENLKKRVLTLSASALQNHLDLSQKGKFWMSTKEEGVWCWLPRGNKIKEKLEKWWVSQLRKEKADFMTTPHILSSDILDSGGEAGSYLFKSHLQFWKESGKVLPCRIAEMAELKALSHFSVKNGLLQSASWTSDRSHLFLKEEELFQECISSLQLITKIPKILGFEFQILLSVKDTGFTRARPSSDKKSLPSFLKEVLDREGIAYSLCRDPALEGGGARIEVQIADALGRWWDSSFIELKNLKSEGKGVFCVERSLFSSLERLVALSLERKEGRLPFWLSPEQLKILSLEGEAGGYAQRIKEELENEGISVSIDSEDLPLKERLHRAFIQKIPFVALIGKREAESGSVSYRTLESTESQKMEARDFINMMIELNRSKDSEFEN